MKTHNSAKSALAESNSQSLILPCSNDHTLATSFVPEPTQEMEEIPEKSASLVSMNTCAEIICDLCGSTFKKKGALNKHRVSGISTCSVC